MRIALIAAERRTATGDLRAQVPFAGRTVLEWQGEQAIEWGCERIVCLCEQPSGAVIDLQRRVEGDQIDFHAVRKSGHLASLIRPDDELVVMLDGLVMDRSAARELVHDVNGLRPAIATVPPSQAMAQHYPRDFERIDKERHWAGLMVMSASNIEAIAELPDDVEPLSILLRLALQSGVPCYAVAERLLSEDKWVLADRSEVLAAHERELVDSSITNAETKNRLWAGPGVALACLLVRATALKGLDNGAGIAAGIAALLLASGIVLATLGHAALGLGVAALGGFSAKVSELWLLLIGRLWSGSPTHSRLAPSWIAFELGAAISVSAAFFRSDLVAISVVFPMLAFAVSCYLSVKMEGWLGTFWEDRGLHLLLLALAASVELLDEALAVFGFGALCCLLLRIVAEKPIRQS